MNVVTPSRSDLERKRATLLRRTHMPENELRRRAETYQVSVQEADALRAIDQIDFLLGDDD